MKTRGSIQDGERNCDACYGCGWEPRDWPEVLTILGTWVAVLLTGLAVVIQL